MSLDEQMVARIAKLEEDIEKIKTRERPLALRGWRDDFLGDALHEQYTTEIFGVNSIVATLWIDAHGGWANLQSGDGAGRYSYLWLGDAADGYATLDADEGWTQIVRMKISHTTSIAGDFGAVDSAFNNIILVGMNTTAVAANWYLETRTGGGALNNIDSGVAADTDWHVHRFDVYPVPVTGVRQVDYFLDGARIATTTVSVPTIVLTPIVRCYSTAAALRNIDVDFWAVIPKNL